MTTNDKELTTRDDQRTRNLPSRIERQYRVPASDVYETPDAYVLMIDLPGASKENISVRIEGGDLLVRAELSPLHGDDAVILHREHVADGYDRAFTLGDDVDANSVDAQLENGVLVLKLLKSEKVKAREITIR